MDFCTTVCALQANAYTAGAGPSSGGQPKVSLMYHYTGALSAIQQHGMMTAKVQQECGFRGHSHGAFYGDGVYCSPNTRDFGPGGPYRKYPYGTSCVLVLTTWLSEAHVWNWPAERRTKSDWLQTQDLNQTRPTGLRLHNTFNLAREEAFDMFIGNKACTMVELVQASKHTEYVFHSCHSRTLVVPIAVAKPEHASLKSAAMEEQATQLGPQTHTAIDNMLSYVPLQIQ